jgi:hypothetical protein
MFGNRNGSAPPVSKRPAAAGVARMDAHLTHIIASPDAADGIQVFTDGRPLDPGALESLGINIIAPTDAAPAGTLTGVLSRYSGEGAGDCRPQTASSLFPGTVEIIARGRRIVVTCVEDGSFDGLWVGLGLREDGTSTELSGVGSLRIVVTPSLLDARLTWSEDGIEEELFPDL